MKRKNKSLAGKFHKRFPDLKYSKLILYRNPSEFTKLNIERINPNHHGIIWGQRKKSLGKGSAYIKAGEIFFGLTATYILWQLGLIAFVDMITGYIYGIMIQTTLLSLCVMFILSVLLYYMPLKLSEGVTDGV